MGWTKALGCAAIALLDMDGSAGPQACPPEEETR